MPGALARGARATARSAPTARTRAWRSGSASASTCLRWAARAEYALDDDYDTIMSYVYMIMSYMIMSYMIMSMIMSYMIMIMSMIMSCMIMILSMIMM